MAFHIFRALLYKWNQYLFILWCIFFSAVAHAATYNLSTGSYPPCVGGSGWSVSGTTYTCGGNGRVTLDSGDIVLANTNVTIFANNGFSLTNNTIGSASAAINLTSNYGTVTSTGTNTINGAVNAGGSTITFVNTTVNGSLVSGGGISLSGGSVSGSVVSNSGGITTNNTAIGGALSALGNVNLSGGSVAGLVTSVGNTITTNATNLSSGAHAQSGMSITGGTIAGDFVMTSNNVATFSGVTMTSGSISGASTVTIQNGSVLGSTTSAINISSNSGAITLNNSTVYGNLTAPNYSTVNVNNGSAVYGTCTPGSTPTSACSGTTINACPAGYSSGITGNYFNNTSLTEPVTATRVDAPINFSWGAAAPGPTGIGADNFSTRWSGYVRATQSGIHRFQTVSDDGVRLYVNGNLVISRWNAHSSTTDTTGDIALVAGQVYSIVLEYYEAGGDAEIRLRWLLPGASAYVPIPAGPTPSLGAGLYECTPTVKPPISSCPSGMSAGITGDYFSNQTLTAPVTNRRKDGPINFDWGTGTTGVSGIGDNNFSVRWNGYVRATQTGVYRFQTNSDDGVRLTVNGDLLIDQWNDHSVATHTSAAVNLVAGNNYPIRMEFYENSGFAVAQLLWQTPSSSSYVSIPIGSTPISNAGLYECATTPARYSILNNTSGLTCAAEAVTVTALNDSGVAFNPPAGTVVTMSTNPATGVWVGGNTYTYSGTESTFTKYLQKSTPGSLDITAASSPTVTGSSSITFADVGLKIADNFSQIPPASPPAVVNQISGVPGTARLKVIRKDNNTGACVAQVGAGTRSVALAYSCVNPISCITGQTFTVNGTSIAGNNSGSTINYSAVNVTFNNSGEAPLAINYSDAGQVRLHGQLVLTATASGPAMTLSGDSDLFVVKPHSIAVSAVQRSNGTANPGGTNTAGATAQFVAANEPFRVLVEARNATAALTPNFGRETSPQTKNLKIKTKSLVYPALGEATALTAVGSPSTITPQGTFLYSGVRWKQVGSILIEPHFDDEDPQTTNDGDYLGAGNILNLVASSTVGRFYPDHFEVKDITLSNSCGAFSYMEQPLSLRYTIEAREFGYSSSSSSSSASSAPNPSALTNYDNTYVNGSSNFPVSTYVAESENLGADLGARINDGGVEKNWVKGSLIVIAPNAVFSRSSTAALVDGPYTNTQVGIKLTDSFDLRAITALDMNANTIGTCSALGCTAKALGAPLNVRYGRLKLDNAFGSGSAQLPVNFFTEHWIGNRFVRNLDDNCTAILRSAITYPSGNISTPANLTVALTGGSTTGNYAAMTGTHVTFGAGDARQFFSAPGAGATGNFSVSVDLTAYPWLRFDWNQTGKVPTNTECISGTPEDERADCRLRANFGFGDYRGHDRVIYWRERFQ